MPAVAEVADVLGFESVWVPEHLVFPVEITGSPHPGVSPRLLRPDIPTYDVLVFLATIAVRTSRVRLGTWVYNLALRHPLVSARAVQTLDIVSGGRVVLGVGAGWLEGEYAAAGVDFASRGTRLDECIDALRELWSADAPRFDGAHVAFPPVTFEPKPIQGSVPIHVGGESRAALRRAAARGDGWLGMAHDVDSAADRVRSLRDLRQQAGRDDAPFEVTVGATPRDRDELAAFAAAGVDRVIATPWGRGDDPVDGLRAYARTLGLTPRPA
jgi:probable F420-dependent oxidoreductase